MKYNELRKKQKDLKREIDDIQDQFERHQSGKGNPHLNYYAMLGADSRRIETCRELTDIESQLGFIRFKFLLIVSSLIAALLCIFQELIA